MTLPVFRADTSQLAVNPGDTILLTGEEGRHAATVKRLRIGEELIIGDGHGTVTTCVVTELVDKGTLAAEVCSRDTIPAAHPAVTIVQAIPKGERAELSVDLATQAGADTIIPWKSSRTIPKWNDKKAQKSREKWQKTATEAAKQARRAWDPQVAPLAGLRDITELVAQTKANGGLTAILHESATSKFAELPFAKASEIVLIIGPEGGLSDEEIAALEEAGGQTVIMGNTVLRTASAAAVALGALGVLAERW